MVTWVRATAGSGADTWHAKDSALPEANLMSVCGNRFLGGNQQSKKWPTAGNACPKCLDVLSSGRTNGSGRANQKPPQSQRSKAPGNPNMSRDEKFASLGCLVYSMPILLFLLAALVAMVIAR
jgi:hypothetical protein